MPLAMFNLVIAQHCAKERYSHLRGGRHDIPKAKVNAGEMVMLRQEKDHTLQLGVRPHILRIIELRGSGMVILQGSDGATVIHQISHIAKCSVPISDTKVYSEKHVRTDAVHCKQCGSGDEPSNMLLCDTCNQGYHTTCIYILL